MGKIKNKPKKQASSKAKTNKSFNIVSAVLAFFIYGSWAYFINLESSIAEIEGSPLKSGISQGISSFITTIFIIYVVTYFYNLLPKRKATFPLPAFLSTSLVAIFLVFVHTLANTMNILLTITPSLLIGFLFCLVVTFKLNKFYRAKH